MNTLELGGTVALPALLIAISVLERAFLFPGWQHVNL